MVKKKQAKGVKVSQPSFHKALISLNVLGSLWRTAIAFAVILTVSVIVLVQGAYISATFNGGASLATVLSDSYIFNESLQGLLVFVLAFFIYDAVYCGIVRRYPMRENIDRAFLFLFEVVILGGLLVSTVIQAAGDWRVVMAVYGAISSMMTIAMFGALLLPAARAVAGVSWVMARVRVRKRP